MNKADKLFITFGKLQFDRAILQARLQANEQQLVETFNRLQTTLNAGVDSHPT